jgi:DNA/RNA-binding domain of Phe-tRNA-synthetase-like protein
MEVGATMRLSSSLATEYPNVSIGVLVIRDVTNQDHHPDLDRLADELTQRLRSDCSGMDRAALKSLPSIAAYEGYYRQFKKSYHVRLQLESVLLKGKSLPHSGTLVQAMFMAELKNQLLTAGHDADLLQLPLEAATADGSERYTIMNGAEQVCKAGDMKISDGDGVVSSIVYGPDSRTRLRSDTKAACYTTYGVPGIGAEEVRAHLCDLRDFVLSGVPNAVVEELEVSVPS